MLAIPGRRRRRRSVRPTGNGHRVWGQFASQPPQVTN